MRSKDTTPQTSLTKAERLTNMTDAFAVVNAQKLASIKKCTVVLIDDVITTGSTLKVARAALAPLLPPDTKLITLALAH